MKRFVSYIYQYDQGIRGKNAGFVKVDIRDAGCRMEIQIRGLDRFQGQGRIYLIASGEKISAIPAGKIPIGQGTGHIQLSYPHNLLGDSGYTTSQILAVIIRYGGGKLLASCWSDTVPKEILLGQFEIPGAAPEQPELPQITDIMPEAFRPKILANTKNSPEPMPAESAGQNPVTPPPAAPTEPLTMPAATTEPAEQNPVTPPPAAPTELPTMPAATAEPAGQNPVPVPPPEPIGQNPVPAVPPENTESLSVPDSSLPENTAQIHAQTVSPAECPCQKQTGTTATPPAKPQISFEKIEITDIRKLPKQNWYLCNNSFLIHGFFNYHYLMLKTVETDGEKKCYLGVPGIFEQPERMMALLFGFPEFEPAQADKDNLHNGVFGYWMCQLNPSTEP